MCIRTTDARTCVFKWAYAEAAAAGDEPEEGAVVEGPFRPAYVRGSGVPVCGECMDELRWAESVEFIRTNRYGLVAEVND